MPQEIIRCENLSKSYQQGNETLEILKSIDFSVCESQRCAIIGASGSGKSTLLSLIGGLDKPTSGEVKVKRQAIADMDDVQLSLFRNQELGFVYQFHHLLPEFTALENVAMPQLIQGIGKKEAHKNARKCLDQVGLSERLTHLPSELSGGERQRVAIARALVNEPSCVLMDEPTGALDKENSMKVLSLIEDLGQRSSAAFVIVTHDPQVAAAMNTQYKLENACLSSTGN